MTDTVAKLGVTLTGDAKALEGVLSKAQRELEAFERQFGKAKFTMPAGGGPAVAFDKAAIAAQRLATEQEKTALAAQRVNTEAARTAAVIQRSEQQAARFAQSMGSATAQVKRTADGLAILPRSFAGLSGQAASFASSLLGVGTALTAIGAAGAIAQQGFNIKANIDAGRASLGAFLGDQERANQAFADGARFADQYAIKQSEIAGALSSLAPLLRTSTTETEKQLEVLARLQTLRPGATFQDAAFSVKELAGGDYASIVEQFNLSRAAAQRLRDEVAQGADVFAVLDAELNNMGASSEVLASRLEGAAGAQNQYAAAMERASIAIGALVTGPGTALLNFLADSAEGTTEFLNLIQGITGDELSAGLIAAGQSYEIYAQRAREAALAQQELAATKDPLGALFGLYPQVQALSEAQYAFAQSLIQSGSSAQAAYAQVQGLVPLTETYAQVLNDVAATAGPEAAAAIQGLEPAILSAASASDSSRAAVEALLESYLQLGDGSVDLAAGLAEIEQANALAAFQAQEHATAQAVLAQEAAAVVSILDQTALAANAEEKALQAATQAAFEQANAGASLEAQARAAAQALLEAGGAGASAAAQLAGSSSRVDQLTAAYYRLIAAQQAAGAGGGALSNLGETVKGAGEATAAIRALYKTYGAGPLALPKTTGRKGKGGKSDAEKAAEAEAKAAEKRAEQIAQIEERAREAQLAAEAQFREDMLAIQERYNEAVLDAQRDLQAESAGSRADFYDSLTQADVAPEIAQQLSAAYEQAFAEAQRLSQEGKAELAADYLALKQEQIAAEQKFQEARAKAVEDGDKAEIARLEAIKKLRDAEFSARESNLMAEGDANVTQRDEAVEDAQLRQQEALAKAQIATQDAALEAEGKTREAARLTNEEYLERLRLLQQIGPQAGGRPPPEAGAAPVAVPAPTDPLAGGPGAAASPVVSAPDVVDAVAAVRDAVSAVERAVGRLGRSGTVGGLG